MAHLKTNKIHFEPQKQIIHFVLSFLEIEDSMIGDIQDRDSIYKAGYTAYPVA